MRAFACIACVLLAPGCRGTQPALNAASVDIDAAAEDAEKSIANYAATRPASPRRALAELPEPRSKPAAPIRAGAAPLVADSAQGAADVVRSYFALLGEGKYRQAWLLWGEEGEASGLSDAAFAAQFARYGDYRAEVGAPGEIDAGAGQRYVAVPVQVDGRAGGEPFRTLGKVTLLRVGDIDGATREQRSWRIRSISVDPVRGTAQ